MKTSYEARTGHARYPKPGKAIERKQKRLEAELRQAEYNKLSIQEKIAKLIPGGSAKQRVKLGVLFVAKS